MTPNTPIVTEDQLRRALQAADKLDIIELGARFDNALDAERLEDFLGVFTEGGVLAGFWGESTGAEQIAGAFHFMLGTFARGRRHMLTNQVVVLSGDTATMQSYMVVQDQATNGSIGTAVFRDQLRRDSAGWRFVRRSLSADANVQPLIAALQPAQ